MKSNLRYFNSTASKGEKVLYSAELSKFYKRAPIIFFTVLSLPFLFAPVGDVKKIGLAFLLFAFIHFLKCRNTEYVLSNKRVIAKKGIITCHTEELKLSKIESCEMKKDLTGALIGCGNIVFRGLGSSFVAFNDVENPIKVKKEIEEILEENGALK